LDDLRDCLQAGLSGRYAVQREEQASGERQVDARSDISSLGCVLYEMLVGESGSFDRLLERMKLTDLTPVL
jgi:serine/threonine protein kinase